MGPYVINVDEGVLRLGGRTGVGLWSVVYICFFHVNNQSQIGFFTFKLTVHLE